jgi:hypothetical protein
MQTPQPRPSHHHATAHASCSSRLCRRNSICEAIACGRFRQSAQNFIVSWWWFDNVKIELADTTVSACHKSREDHIEAEVPYTVRLVVCTSLSCRSASLRTGINGTG